MPPSLSKMICNQHIVCLGTFIKRLASHLPNIIRRRLHDAGSPEAGTHNKTNLDDEPLQDRCSEGPRWFIVRFLAKSWHDAVAVWTATPAPAPVDYNTKFPKYSMYIYVKDWLYIVKLLHSPVVASSGGKGGEAQLIGCPTQVTSSRSVIQLDSVKISSIERCNETDR